MPHRRDSNRRYPVGSCTQRGGGYPNSLQTPIAFTERRAKELDDEKLGVHFLGELFERGRVTPDTNQLVSLAQAVNESSPHAAGGACNQGSSHFRSGLPLRRMMSYHQWGENNKLCDGPTDRGGYSGSLRIHKLDAPEHQGG